MMTGFKVEYNLPFINGMGSNKVKNLCHKKGVNGLG